MDRPIDSVRVMPDYDVGLPVWGGGAALSRRTLAGMGATVDLMDALEEWQDDWALDPGRQDDWVGTPAEAAHRERGLLLACELRAQLVGIVVEYVH